MSEGDALNYSTRRGTGARRKENTSSLLRPGKEDRVSRRAEEESLQLRTTRGRFERTRLTRNLYSLGGIAQKKTKGDIAR